MIGKYFKSLDLLKAFQQFPLSSCIAIVATFGAILFIDYPENDILPKLVAAGYLAFLTAISAEILSNKHSQWWILIIPFLVFLGWYFYLPADLDSIPHFMEERYAYRYAGSALILHLIISFVPYLKSSSEEDFWEYNKHLFLRIFESGLFTIVTFVGLSLAILAVDKLFGIDVEGEWYARLFVFLSGIFNSLYFLSKYPVIDYDGKTEAPFSAYKVFSQYILIGISTIYMVLLYAYALKILIEGELPQGWIGYLTLCFSVIGILTWLLNYFNPKFSHNKFTKFFVNHFFQFLTIPVVMLLVAITIRLKEYGITENRYIVAILASWLGFLVLGYGWVKQLHIKFIPLSFAVLTAFSIFGYPLDMFTVSTSNQADRLHQFLVDGKILVDETLDLSKIEKMDNSQKYELKKRISALGNRADLERIDEWVKEPLFENFSDSIHYSKTHYLHKKLKITSAFENIKGEDNYFHLNSRRETITDIRGYNSMTYANFSLFNDSTKNNITIHNDHQITFGNYDTLSLKNLILSHLGDQSNNIISSEMTLIFKNQTDSSKLILEHLGGKINEGKITIENVHGQLFDSR